jgi:hypothetical protein
MQRGGDDMSAVTHVHKDLRKLAKELELNGCVLEPRGAHKVDVRKGSVVVTTLPSASQRGSENQERTRRQLQRLGLLPESARKPHRPRKEQTAVERALREAAQRKGARELKDDEPHNVPPPDVETPDRGSRRPRDVGVLRPYDGRRSPVPSLRYIGNPAWGAHVVRRINKHLEAFDTKIMFVDFAIEVAKDRHLPPPNTRRGAKRDPWDRTRIAQVLDHLMNRRNAKSLTLQFFSAACDELEGLPGGSYRVDPSTGDLTPEAQAQVEAAEVTVVEVDSPEAGERSAPSPPEEPHEDVPEATSGPQETPVPALHMTHKERLAEILLDKLEAGDEVDEGLVDRIERLLEG